MEPNNIPQPQQAISPSSSPASSSPAPLAQAPQQPAPAIKPNNTNYAAAVFFTLLIIGFTFHLPSLLFGPVIFFCIVAGVLFFKDTLSVRKALQPIPGQPGVYNAPASAPAPHKKRNIFVLILLIIFGLIGLAVMTYIAFIIFIVVMLSASGV